MRRVLQHWLTIPIAAGLTVLLLLVLQASAQTSWCMRDCGQGFASCKSVIEIRDRLDEEARARGWTNDKPLNYWNNAAEERRQIERDYCMPTRCTNAGVDERLCQAQ